MSLRGLRKGRKRTHVALADALSVGRGTLCWLERRSNITLLTLDRHIKAIGGEVLAVAEFPDRPPAQSTFDEMSTDSGVERWTLRAGARTLCLRRVRIRYRGGERAIRFRAQLRWKPQIPRPGQPDMQSKSSELCRMQSWLSRCRAQNGALLAGLMH